ncbi:hypothetical protein SUS17_1426 [Sphingomonas sp. S17]|nr:hypothetical protein SUS17_1426 [Sphingomonas sp. S17]
MAQFSPQKMRPSASTPLLVLTTQTQSLQAHFTISTLTLMI